MPGLSNLRSSGADRRLEVVSKAGGNSPQLNGYMQELNARDKASLGKSEQAKSFYEVDSLVTDLFTDAYAPPDSTVGEGFVYSFASDRSLRAKEHDFLDDLAETMTEFTAASKESMVFQPISKDAEDMIGGLVGVRDGNRISEIYQIGLHETPGLPGGLMSVQRVDDVEQMMLPTAILRSGHGRNLESHQLGWNITK